jgi:hypothetical protein
LDIEDLFEKHGSAIDRLSDAVGTIDVFERQMGAEFTSWELAMQKRLKVRLSGNKFKISGFVHHTRDPYLILLTPSPWLLEGVFAYFRRDQEIPNEGSLVEIIGKSIAAPRMLEHGSKTVQAITAESVEEIPQTHISQITPPLNLRGIADMLFEHVGMAEASKRVFARLFVSSPPFQENIGGLTTGIQAIASKSQVNRLLSFVRNVVPPSMRGKRNKTRDVRGVRVAVPKIWRMDVGRPSVSKMRTICINRRDPSGYSEVSLSAMTNKKTASLPDVPIALASEDFWVETAKPTQLQLPILKAAITYKLMTPQISSRSIDAGVKHVVSRLETLRDSFGLDKSALAKGRVLDADVIGRPLSTIRIARSTARARWKEKLTAKDLKKAWNSVLEPALKEFLELTATKEQAQQQWGEESRIDKFNTKVLQALQKLDSGKKGSLGPNIQDIAHEAGVELHEAADALARMRDSGAVYEPRPGHFRIA